LKIATIVFEKHEPVALAQANSDSSLDIPAVENEAVANP
jgi:hypothetical protein